MIEEIEEYLEDLDDYLYKQIMTRFCRVDHIYDESYFDQYGDVLARQFAPGAEFVHINSKTFITQIGLSDNYDTGRIQHVLNYFDDDYNKYKYHYMNLYIKSSYVDFRIYTHFRYVTFCLWN